MDLSRDLDYGRRGLDSTRMVGIGFVVVLHLAIIYFLINAFGSELVALVHGPMKTSIINSNKVAAKVVPPPPKFIPPPPDYIPPPDVNIAQSATTSAITNVTAKAAPPPPPPKAHRKTAPRLASGGSCEPDYPSVSKDLEEEGTAIVRFTVNADGSASNPVIISSSGHSRLDNALIQKVVTCSFIPGTDDGNPTAATKDLQYRFVLEDQ